MKFWLLMFSCSLSLVAQQVTVIDPGAGWTLSGGTLHRRTTIPAYATLTGKGPSALVLDCSSNGVHRWFSYMCAAAPCEVPACSENRTGVKVKRVDPYAWAERPDESLLSRMLAAFFTREPQSIENVGVRAAGNLTDAIVRQIGDRVFWAPALSRLIEGSYCFQLDRLPATGSSKPIIFVLDWDSEDTQKKDGASLLPGLISGSYTLRRGTPAEGMRCRIDDPDAAPAWVDVVPDSSFEEIQAEWQRDSVGFDKLVRDVGPDVASVVRHAVLSYLADSIGK